MILGQGRAAIIIWALAFLATVLVTVFAKTTGGRTADRPFAGLVLMNAVVVFFCVFLLLTITAFMGAWPPVLGGLLRDKRPTAGDRIFAVNFGCEAGNTASVEFRAPEGYRILNATVEPVDPQAAKTVTPRLLSNDGKTAKGQVEYFGRDRTWLRNCEGGGHGSVRIKGEIVREQSSLGLLISLLLALALIVGLITLFGSIPPPDSGSRTRKMQSAFLARPG
jgi:hypothetical protein